MKCFLAIVSILLSALVQSAHSSPLDSDSSQSDNLKQICSNYLHAFHFKSSLSRAEIATDISKAFHKSKSLKPQSNLELFKLKFVHPGLASNIKMILATIKKMPSTLSRVEQKNQLATIEKNLWGVALALEPKVLLSEMEELGTLDGYITRSDNDLFSYVGRVADRLAELIDELNHANTYYTISKLSGRTPNAPRKPEKIAPDIFETLMVLFLVSGRVSPTQYQSLQDTVVFYCLVGSAALFAMAINDAGSSHLIHPLVALVPPFALFAVMATNGWRRDNLDQSICVRDDKEVSKAKGPFLKPKFLDSLMQYVRARYIRQRVGRMVLERVDRVSGLEKKQLELPVEIAALFKDLSLEVDKFKLLSNQKKSSLTVFLKQMFTLLEENTKQSIFDLMGRFSDSSR